MQHKLLDNFFSVLSCVVSVPFYTGFLPLLFWVCHSCPSGTLTTSCSASVRLNVFSHWNWLQSGHGKLARQMTLLMAFSDYIGNVVKVIIFLSS
jgi:sphingosine-1-phosphate phosphatase 1